MFVKAPFSESLIEKLGEGHFAGVMQVRAGHRHNFFRQYSTQSSIRVLFRYATNLQIRNIVAIIRHIEQ